jgi:hypothetical protein
MDMARFMAVLELGPVGGAHAAGLLDFGFKIQDSRFKIIYLSILNIESRFIGLHAGYRS